MSKLRIKSILSARGMTLKGLAEKMGVSGQFVSQIVNGKNHPTIASLEKVATALEVPMASLFSDYLEPKDSAMIVCPRCGERIDIHTGDPR